MWERMNFIPGLRAPTRGLTLLRNIDLARSRPAVSCDLCRPVGAVRDFGLADRSHASPSTVILSMIIRDEGERYVCSPRRAAFRPPLRSAGS